MAPALGGQRLLAFELVGYGQSWAAGLDRDISLQAQAGYLLGWLDALQIERAVLVGHDLGGGVAQIAAVREPGRCAGLVLSNAVAYDSWPIPSVKAMRAAGGLIERVPTPLLRRQLAFFLRQGHDVRGRARKSLDAHWPGYAHDDGARAFVRQIRSLRTADTMDIANRLPELRIPAAIVWGAADRFQKIAYGRRLAADLRAPLDAIDGGRHFVPEDHPERMAAAIERVSSSFLR